MELILRKLAPDDAEDIYNMLQEIPADENGFINSAHGKTYDEFKLWIEKSYAASLQKGVIDGWKVPETIFWLFEDGKPVGFGKIRHYLTDRLIESGGNIGYSIIPGSRGRGLGNKLVAGLIGEGRKIGVERLLFTIRNSNIPSIRAALANGGVIEKVTDERHYISVVL
ncbi:MAG: GNAT family N-acetyltransferase [Oscillospiraceae bacterium]|nr:GNAT family N-acetyltransferase [Oscillospiraceae bacterium]